jgi:hypothetical protein
VNDLLASSGSGAQRLKAPANSIGMRWHVLCPPKDLAVSHLVKEDTNVPKGKHLRGAGSKEQRQYEHIKESAEKSGRYGGRAKEVAARTVMKEHKEKGHSKGK